MYMPAPPIDPYEPGLSEHLSSEQQSTIKSLKIKKWKPKSATTYETLMLTRSEFNSKVQGAGFRTNGKPRHIKRTCLLSKIKTRCILRERNPAMAICITMYNEKVAELKTTLKGLLHNYNCFRADEDYRFTKDDFLVTIICDGYDKIPDCFKELARDKGFLDEELLISRGFME